MTATKDPLEFYKHCPRCGGELTVKPHHEEKAKLICQKCGFVFHQHPTAAVFALITNNQDELLLVKRRFPPHKNSWDVPGGFIEIGEEAEKAVIREIKEEINVVFRPAKILGTYHDWYEHKGLYYSVINIGFVGDISGLPNAGSDASAVDWHSLSKLPLEIYFNYITRSINDLIKSKDT
ncbi:NUDIX domain-containing protein [Patescibacteria group bacterium]